MEENQEQIQPSFWQKYQKSVWIGLVSMAVLTAALLTYLLFFRQSLPQQKFAGDVRVTVTAPEELSSGSETSYTVKIENRSNTSLLNQQLEIFYPSGFTFVDSTPDATSPGGRQFVFSDLAPGREENLTIVGRLDGELQEIKILGVKLHYVPENFKSEFVAAGRAETTLLAPDLTLAISAPAQAIVGQIVNYEIRVSNVSTRNFANLVIRPRYPEKFVLRLASPTPDPTGQWRITNLDVARAMVFKASGVLLGEPGQDAAVSAELLLKNPDGDFVLSHKSVAFTTLKPPPLALTARLVSDRDTVRVGEDTAVEISYRNISETGLTNVQVRLVIASPSMTSLRLTADQAVVRDNIISWIPATASALGVVNPGASGKFSASLTLTDRLVKNLQKNPVLSTRLEFLSSEVPEPLSLPGFDRQVETEVSIQAKARSLGENNYRVEIALANTVNDVTDGELVARVANPGSAITKLENATYSDVTGVLRWRVGAIFPFAGSFHEAPVLTFEITAPEPVLLRDLKFSGQDQFTGNPVQAQLATVTASE